MSKPGARTAEARRLIGYAVALQGVVGLLGLLTQIVLRRELAPGEYGTVNTVLAVVAVVSAPALTFALARQRMLSPQEGQAWKDLRPTVTRLFTFAWGAVSLVLLFSVLPFLALPSASLQMFAVLAAEAALAAKLSVTLCRATNRLRLLAGLLLGAALLRLGVSAAVGHYQPVAQSGIGAFILGALLVGLPALQDYNFSKLGEEGRALLRKFLVPLLATASVSLAIVLFANAHRIVAQANFGAPDPANLGFVDLNRFDDFQAAGLLAQRCLQGTLLLLVFFWAQRVVLERTSLASLRWFWIYLGALVAAAVLLVAAAPWANVLFTGDPAAFLPGFAAPVFMLGLLQGAAVFALASRRWAECFVIGAASIGYTLFLFFAGHQPQIMTSCMFGGALISLMLVLFVGVVRYARSHP